MTKHRKRKTHTISKLYKKLLLLVKQGDVAAVKEIFRFQKHGFMSKLYSRGYYLLKLATENGRSDIASYLMKYGCSVNNATTKTCKTPLYFAVANADLRIVAKLLRRGADVNVFFSVGNNSQFCGDVSVLHVAVKGKMAKIVYCLLTFGANVNSKCQTITFGSGCTPLHLAAETGSALISEQLLINGASADAKTEGGMAPLHIAVLMNNLDVVSELLRQGAYVNIKNCNNGYTALHYAAVNGHEAITEILLRQGGNVNSLAEYNCTPLKCALHNDKTEVAKLITKYIVKMMAEGLHVNSVNNSAMQQNSEKLDFFHEKCESELFSMKQSCIGEGISYFDVLTAQGNQLVTYARHDHVNRVLFREDYRLNFPIYGSLIEGQMTVGEYRNVLIQESRRFFGLPYYCVEIISRYLSNIDLRNVIAAANA